MLAHESDKYPCRICSKTFHRSDLLSKHQKKCFAKIKDTNTCDLCNKSFSQKSHLTRHRKICNIKQTTNKLKQKTKEYEEMLKRGEILEKILQKNSDILEEAMSPADKECLKLYQTSCETNMDINNITLKPWQEEVIRIIDNPSERSIFWIVGGKGNEGKTFIQKYIRQLFGARRVMKSEANTRKVDIAYVLSQDTLTCKDIFLFNLLRSDDEVAYGLLENIKDGYLVSSKYRSKSLKIQTPNTVIVFSNSFPQQSQLSVDRWKIFEIRGDTLYSTQGYITV